MKPLSLYVHIPFCIQKCDYCDFLSFPADDGAHAAYFAALENELSAHSLTFGKDKGDYEVVSIFFGGGTPSAVNETYIERILTLVRTHYALASDAECSIEVNPGTVSKEKLRVYHHAGINRISIGCQSMQEEELQTLGRIHTKEDVIKTFKAARAAGFQNINIDLMSALPDQTFDSYMDSVAQVVALAPEHISAYSLILEEGTPFYEEYSEEVRDEDLSLEMYQETTRYLKEHGYEHYEISNYCLDGYRCRHNVVYWTRGEYLGTGLGAASLICETRFRNTEDFDAYIAANGDPETIREDVEALDYHARMEEYMFLGLRMIEGIRASDFEKTFGHPIRRIYAKAIDELTKDGLLAVHGDQICLTPTGVNVSNYALARFLFDE